VRRRPRAYRERGEDEVVSVAASERGKLMLGLLVFILVVVVTVWVIVQLVRRL
jgi:flagellar biogenesis protein FliO